MTDRLAYSIKDLAAAIGRSERHVRKLIADGDLAAKRDGKGYVITAAAAQKWLDGLEDAS